MEDKNKEIFAEGLVDLQEQHGDAPDPNVLHVELENHLLAHTGGKITRSKAEELIAGLVAIQMAYYARFATPDEIEQSAEAYNAVAAHDAAIHKVLEAGAQMSRTLPDNDASRIKWVGAAQELRRTAGALAKVMS